MIEKLTDSIPAFRGQWAFLSNMAVCLDGIRYNGKSYASVEHAYVAAKFDYDSNGEAADKYEVACSNGITAFEAKRMGRNIGGEAWKAVDKVRLMEQLLKQKFYSPTSYYGRKLLSTGNKNIEELNYWKDFFWGICEGKGENHLGKLLMKIRTELQQEKK